MLGTQWWGPCLVPVQIWRFMVAPLLLLTSEFDFWMSLSGCGSSPTPSRRAERKPPPHLECLSRSCGTTRTGNATPRHAVLSSRRQLFLPSSPCEHLHSARLPPPQIHRINGPRPPTHQPPTPADEFNTKSEAASLIDWSLL